MINESLYESEIAKALKVIDKYRDNPKVISSMAEILSPEYFSAFEVLSSMTMDIHQALSELPKSLRIEILEGAYEVYNKYLVGELSKYLSKRGQ